MGSCAVKSSSNLIEQQSTDVNQVVRILLNSSYGVDVKCPVCLKPVGPDDLEIHLLMCLTQPKIYYNEDKVTKGKGMECVICLEELAEDDVIARLPCLCVYHKACIDKWFRVNRTCPQHPG